MNIILAVACLSPLVVQQPGLTVAYKCEAEETKLPAAVAPEVHLPQASCRPPHHRYFHKSHGRTWYTCG